MGDKNINLSASIKVGRKPKDGTDGVTYEIQLDTDSVVLDSATKQFVTHKLGDVHFIYHQGSYTEDMTQRIIETYSYIILYYGYEGGVYKAISYSSDEGVTDIWNTMQMNVGDDADCYGMKYIWYDKNLPDNDEAMFEKIWSKLDGVPPKELGINILATKMFTVSRNGDSVKSSDVVFGIGTKTQQPTAWITNFEGLTLVEGKYVWTCTKTTLTNGTSYYTGAYCLGECYDFAQVEELYTLSDSPTQAPESGWNTSYKVVKGKYLWSCVKVTYNDANISYLNKKCVSYFPNDGTNGTKFTPKGTAYAHYSKASELPSPSVTTVNRKYLVDIDDKSTPPRNTPCVCYYKNTKTFMSDVAAEGDAYNIGGTLWVHDGKMWHDFGSVQGPKGDDGQDALNIDFSTDRLLFQWINSNFDVGAANVTLIARQGNAVIDPSKYSVKIISTKNYRSESAIIATAGNTYYLTFKADGITMMEYVYNKDVDGGTTISYPASSCAIKLAVTYNGITYTRTIFIDVSFTQTYGDLQWNADQLSATFGKLTDGYDGTLAQMESKVTQNANNIASKVSQTYYDENNKKIDERFSVIEQNVDNIKLEVSATTDGLKATGINITDKTIKMTANNFTLYNNNNEEVFSADENGNGVFKGKVTATSGYIGGLEIYDDTYQLGGQTFNYKGLVYNIEEKEYVPEHTVNVRDRGFYVGFGNSKMGGYLSAGLNGNGGTTTVGGQTEMSYYNILDVFLSTENSVTGQSANAATFIAASKGLKSTALAVGAYGGRENYAVDAGSGDIRVQDGAFIGAFCGNVNKGNNGNNVTDNYTLQPTDSIIVCNNTKEIKITFPREGIKAGQMFIVIAGTSSRINFGGEYGTATSILCQGELYCGTRGQWNFIIFDGNTWHIRMVWN